jgi:hypothetical protein
MSGPTLAADQLAGLTDYVFGQPRPNVSLPADTAAVAAGQALYESPAVGCSGCHWGPKLTNNETMDVGTGGVFQVPSLVGVSWRAPYLHDGCAPSLAARFDLALVDPFSGQSCAGQSHGNTSDLDDVQIASLVAYLQTL